MPVANDNVVLRELSEGAHLRVWGGQILLVRLANGAVALAVTPSCDGGNLRLSPDEARFLARQLAPEPPRS